MTAARIEVSGLTKRFPGVVANDSVDFRAMPGEIHALLGENGAGKSTLVKMMYGLMRADAGQMYIDGSLYAPARPLDVWRRGVGMVFQHFSLFEALTVAENVALGLEGRRADVELVDEICKVFEVYGLMVDLD